MTSAGSSPAAVRPLGCLKASIPAAAWSLAAALLGLFVVTLEGLLIAAVITLVAAAVCQLISPADYATTPEEGDHG